MQLNELLEESSIEKISEKTNIAEENIEYLMNSDFGAIKRVKTLGFISILEREYKVDLSMLRKEALAYYEQHGSNERVTLGLPIMEERHHSGSSKWLWFVVLFLVGYASWFFFTQFDQSQLKNMLPFNESRNSTISSEGDGSEALSIKQVIEEVK